MHNEKRSYTIIVGGFLGLIHSGGSVWDYIQYPLGLHLMGYNVYYIEDTEIYPIYGQDWKDITPTIERLKKIMKYFNLDNRWIYRDIATNLFYGKSKKEYIEICNQADIFVNVSCANVIRDEYLKIPVRILMDTDPMFTQIQIATGQSFTSSKSSLKKLAALHTHHFSFGENINSVDTLIPETGHRWKETRQPVCIDYWERLRINNPDFPFTTLMNWKAGKSLIYGHQSWGQKDITFPTIIGIPGKINNERFKIAGGQTGSEKDFEAFKQLKDSGWELVSSETASGNHIQYQQFISNSKAEISVAKETYVKAKTGWFSGRSANYLATGKPVIAQDTGWSKYYPCGNGLYSFTNQMEAIDAVKEISFNWYLQSKAASEIAHGYFDHNKVLKEMLGSV